MGDPLPPDTPPQAASATMEDPHVIKQELGDLKEQFDQQQALIGQLKDMLKDKDSSLTSREKEVEDLAVRLAKMKPRLERPEAKKKMSQHLERVGQQGPAVESLSSPGPSVEPRSRGGGTEDRSVEEKRLPSSESSSRAKILLLRKQLEENRSKFERQQKENAEKRATMDEMKQRIDKLRYEVEHRDSLIQSLQDGSSSMSDESMTQKLLQQILHKDNTLLELSQKVERLEEIIQEKQETLSEKDRLIESRTEAVTLVAKAENEKNLKTLHELEEVRYQMKKMQEEFIKKEEEYMNDKESLTRDIKERSKKVKQLEDNGRRLENLRFELSTRNAELQEKIVTLQADIKSLKSQAESDRNSSEGKDNILQDLKQKLVKAEAHGQKKLRALEKQLKNIKQDGNFGEQILLLQNSIAELEEEKGNLQLKLVDFDDLKAANEKLVHQRNKLEEQVKQQNNDLDSQLSAITLLETEKIKLVEGINERENHIYDLESELSATKLSLTESNQAKVTLELKLCEIEEQRDMAEKAKAELEGQMSESNIVSVDQLKIEKASLEETLQIVTKERDEWKDKFSGQISTVDECEGKTKRAVQEMEEKTKECKRLMNILTDKENTITTMSIKIDKHDLVIAGIEEKLTATIKEADEKKMELEEMRRKFQEEMEMVTHLNSQLEGKSAELHAKENELITLNQTVETLNRTVNERNISIQNLVGEVSSLQDEIKVKDKSIDGHIKRLEKLEAQLHHQDTRIEELHTLCMQKEQLLSEESKEVKMLRNELTSLSQKYETTKSSLETELNIVVTMMNDLKNKLEAADLEVKVKEKEIQNNQIVISKYEEEVCSKNVLIDEIETNKRSLQEKVNELSLALTEKENNVLKLQTEVEEYASHIESLNEHIGTLEKRLSVLQKEKSQLSQMQVALQDEVNETKSLVHQKEESLLYLNTEIASKSHELTHEAESLRQELEEKNQHIVTLENSFRSLTSDLESKASEVEKWQTEALEKSDRLAELARALDSAHLEVQEKDATVTELYTLIAQNQEQLTVAQEEKHHAQTQLSELQETYRLKEGELLEIQNQLHGTQTSLAEIQDQLEKSQSELSSTYTKLQEALGQCQNNSSVISQLEQDLLSKSTTMKTAEDQLGDQLENTKKELEAVSAELQTQKSKVANLEKEIQESREYAENLEIGSTKVHEWATQLQSELETAKAQKTYIDNELSATKDELMSKSSQLEKLQNELEQERQSAQSLQAELSHALTLSEQNEGEVKAISLSQQQKISQLESQLLAVTQARDQLETDIQEVKNLLQSQTDFSVELNANVESLQEVISKKDEEIQMLQSTLLENQKAKAEIESSLKNVMEAKANLESNIPSQSHPSFLADDQDTYVFGLKNELEAAQIHSQLLEKEHNTLHTEINSLKQQLQEARQTITQLQTSLAGSATPPQPEWDDWGEVDLGTPDSQGAVQVQADTDVINLKKALADKDELLQMIQEQLKEALQQVNTITEEKKVLEQKRRSDEVAAAQQQQQQDHLKNELNTLSEVQSAYEEVKQKVTELENELAGKQHEIEILQHTHIDPQGQQHQTVAQDQQMSVGHSPEGASDIHPSEGTSDAWPADSVEAQGEGIQPSAVLENEEAVTSRTQPAADDPFSSLNTANAESSEQDPASWFDQESIQQQPFQTTEVAFPQETSSQPLPEQTQTESQTEISLEELQYKLSWYEENWSTWTGHYTQLQETHQEAQQQIAQLTHQLQELQVTSSQNVDTMEKSTTDDSTLLHNEISNKQQQITDLQNKLAHVEETFDQLKGENSTLKEKIEYFKALEAQSDLSSDSGLIATRLAEADVEVDRLRGFETQVYELQSQVQALQHQCNAMQNKLAEAETERTRLHEIEVLYGELQSCIQESETKREGSKSRVQELELMVQSAESEISRLRNEIEVLNQASEAVQSDRERLETDAHGLGAEMTKLDCEVQHLQSEVKKYKKEIGRLQNDNDASKAETLTLQNEIDQCKAEILRLERENEGLQSDTAGTRSQYQRLEQESNQLRSELEVMEGEHGRLRCDYEILEGENSRVRGEYEALSQASQLTEAEKESLDSEVQRITTQNNTLTSESKHLRDEIQRLTEVSTSAETEINRLRLEIERFRSLDSQYRELEGKYSDLQSQVASFESVPSSKSIPASEPYNLLAEIDWGAEGHIEDEHLLQSSGDAKYQEEIESLKEKLIALEKEKNGIYDELQAAKMKSGKMLQKLKLTQNKNESLTKEIQKLKAKAGGFSDLDQALEEEWKAQVTRAETERDELKQKLDEAESEKEHLASQVDVLTAAQEKYLELKENQDSTLQLMRVHNKELEGQVHALEWRISELEESLEEQQKMESPSTDHPAVRDATGETKKAAQPTEELYSLSKQVSDLQQEVEVLKSENSRLQICNEEFEEKIRQLSSDNESFQSLINSLKASKAKAEMDVNNYKSSYIELDSEHNTLKKEKEKANEELRELTYTHDTLKAAYNSMFSEYNDLRDVSDSYKHDVGILKGERDRLVEEVESLKKQLGALHEEEEEEIIRALQDECFSLREQNNLLHEGNTALEVQAEDAKEKVSRINNALDQNLEVQQLLRDELTKKNEEMAFHTTTIEGQDRQIAYLNAEIAAMKAKLTQYDQAEESSEELTQKLQQQVEQLQEVNQQLQLQVKSAETSLTKLARSGQEEDSSAFTPMDSSSSELEAALASLHLRDLRCQQLSLEITKLLEERDALQLKLSASLRQTQELSRELSLSHQLPPPASPAPSLHQKLAELRELNDSLEQKALSSLQVSASGGLGQRMSVPGLPPSPMFVSHTAPATPTATRHADYTLTRETQGTSSTLFDWLMGKSTPRVMHV